MKRLFFIALIFLGGCASLNKVDSTHETNKKSNEYPNYDAGLKIHYQITNDEKNLHLKFNTSEATTITKILTSGLKICFDVKGNKNKKLYLEYPLAQKQILSDRIIFKSNGRSTKFNLNDLMTQMPKEAVFSSHGKMERFLVLSTDSDIKVSIIPKKNTMITYDLLIPFKRISEKGLSSLSKLSIGIVTAKNNVNSISDGSDRYEGDRPGEVTRYNRNGSIMTSGNNAFSKSGGNNSIGKSRGNNSVRTIPIVRYNNSKKSPVSKSNAFWFKINLYSGK